MSKFLTTLLDVHTAALKIEGQHEKPFVPPIHLEAQIRAIAGVQDIVKVLEATVLVKSNGHYTIATIKGVSSNFASSDFYKKCQWIDADILSKGTKPYAIIGAQISKFLASPAYPHKIEVFVPKPQLAFGQLKPYKCMMLKVIGRFSLAPKIDRTYIIAPLYFVEQLTEEKKKCAYWEIVVQPQANIAYLQAAIQTHLPVELKINNRYEQNKETNRAILIEQRSIYFIVSLVLLLGSFHVFFTLCMLIIDKQKEITILASLGCKPRTIGTLFFYNGCLVSLKSIVYGLFIGWFSSLIQQKLGIIMLNATTSYPVEIHYIDFLYTAIATLFFSALSALWPANQAMRLATQGIK